MCTLTRKSSQLGFSLIRGPSFIAFNYLKPFKSTLRPGAPKYWYAGELKFVIDHVSHLFLEYQLPNVIYPDFDHFEDENKTDEWRKHFKFTLEECKLEDFQETVNYLYLPLIL